MKNFLVKYWSSDGKLVGMQVCAMSPIEAQEYVKSMPNFQTIASFPQEI